MTKDQNVGLIKTLILLKDQKQEHSMTAPNSRKKLHPPQMYLHGQRQPFSHAKMDWAGM